MSNYEQIRKAVQSSVDDCDALCTDEFFDAGLTVPADLQMLLPSVQLRGGPLQSDALMLVMACYNQQEFKTTCNYFSIYVQRAIGCHRLMTFLDLWPKHQSHSH